VDGTCPSWGDLLEEERMISHADECDAKKCDDPDEGKIGGTNSTPSAGQALMNHEKLDIPMGTDNGELSIDIILHEVKRKTMEYFAACKPGDAWACIAGKAMELIVHVINGKDVIKSGRAFGKDMTLIDGEQA